ncbi:nitrogen regulatory protein P-II [Chloroherpeton thalassium ATCC 35110]|uniref:Nitrogen regulatory protein P-II n=1 Tax=Chloroherpeton thalassium (strain ATCC 35110 / GB-78) TaxID=517418 RepID=B3QTT8_CHLT3|nr:P-II family nitrogen regulator [Chloroherpeton thalassium]ACF14286.1 nitrogen regulatory protein P-II [Chloroherpeton thalassium ATCC 35110]
MKMIRAMVRPEATDKITEALAEAGYFSLTKMPIFGRGKQVGIKVGDIHYDELPKVMMMLVVDSDSVDQAVQAIKAGAYTGNFGDGKIFVTPVDAAYTVRTGETGI